MLQRFIAIGLMGLILSITACDRLSQLEPLEQGSQVSPLRPTPQRTSPAIENAIQDSALDKNTIKAPTADATTERTTAARTTENPASNPVSPSAQESPQELPLEETWLPNLQRSASAQLKADLKEQARRAKQTP
jgi:hypothetical protein